MPQTESQESAQMLWVNKAVKFPSFHCCLAPSKSILYPHSQIHANCRIRRVYFSDRLYSEDELPAEFKLYLPVQNKAKVRQPFGGPGRHGSTPHPAAEPPSLNTAASPYISHFFHRHPRMRNEPGNHADSALSTFTRGSWSPSSLLPEGLP